MTLFLFPLPFLCLSSFDISHTWAVGGQLRDQGLDEKIIGHSIENLKYIVAIDSVKSLFPYLRKELKSGLDLMLIRVKVKTSHIFLYLLK